MKQLLLLLLLCPLAAFAEFFPGTVTFNDGSTKTGFVEIPPRHDKGKLKFRATKKGDTEKFKIDDVKQFVITNEKEEEVTFLALKLADLRMFKKEFKIADDKSWVKLLVKGKINIVSFYYYSAAIHGAIGSTATSGSGYYFWKPENDYCTYFYDNAGSGLSVTVGAFKALKEGVRINFEKECPQLSEKMQKEDIKKNGLERIVRLYEETCN